MSAALEKIEPETTTTEVMASTSPVMSAIMSMASNADFDVDKMDRLLQMQERMEAKEAEKAFNADLADAQSEMAPVVRDASNDQTRSNYATLEAVHKQIKPIITKHGFSLSFAQGETDKEGHYRVTCALRHKGGHTVEQFMDIPSDGVGMKGNANKTNTHAFGSSMSYGRRYLTLAIFNISTADDDDDGNAAGNVTITSEQREILQGLIDDTQSDISKFCNALKVDALANLPLNQFGYAHGLLVSKKKQAAKNG